MSLDWAWLGGNAGRIAALLGEHALLSVVPVLAALLAAIPIGYLVSRAGRAAAPILAVLGVISSIPALALFVALPLILGTQLVNPLNIAVALAVYALALLVHSVVDGLRSVPADVRQAATASGYGGFARLLRVDLPLAMPAVFAGLRVATVSAIALVSVAAVLGGGALGRLFDEGLAERFYTPVVVGLVLSLLLALLADALILLVRRNVLPWARGRRPA